MSRSLNEFVTVFCNSCGKSFHPRYGKEMNARFCSIDCTYQRHLDKKYILQARIRNNMKIKNSCWEWQGNKNDAGYGIMRVGTYNVRSHRASYEAFKGEIPEGMVVCHSCDNPSCVNPDHLWCGTKKENTQDMYEKGRQKHTPTQGTDHPKHKLNEEQVMRIKKDNRTAIVIANEYGVSQSLIYGIRRGANWGWLKKSPAGN